MAPHTAELPSWQLPAVGLSPCYGASPTWIVVFLCTLDEDQRREILDKLCCVDKRWTESRPAADGYKVKRLIEVPWLRDSEPSSASIPSAIFQIYRAMHYPNSLILIDRQSVTDDTAIIFKGEGGDGEAARVPMGRAALALSLTLRKSMAEVLPDFESVKIISEGSSSNSLDEQNGKTEMVYRVPNHLPSDLKLEPSTLSIISLVHIPDEKISEIKAAIGSSDAIPHVVIYNWPPDQEPCSRAEMYRIFQATKPPCQEDVDETFSIFIDHEMHNEGYYIIVAQETLSAHNHICLSRLYEIGDALQFWHAIWHPFEHGRRGTRCGDARVNTTIFDGPLRSRTGRFEVVSCPDNLAFSTPWCDFCCFILSQMTETQFRHVRQELFSDVENTLQFVDVSKLIKTPDIQGLMEYFESDEYVKSGQEELPYYFLAIDDRTLKGVENDDYENLIIAADKSTICVDIQDDDDNYYGSWFPGYAYGRLDADSAVNLCSNLSCANMDFIEFCPDFECSYWSVFQQWKDVNEDMIKKELGRISLKGLCCDLEDMST